MGHVLSLHTVYEMARVTVPTFFESFVREIDREEADRRIADFARRVVDKARIHLHVEGQHLIPGDTAVVFMANHQSHMDIPVSYASIGQKTVRMVGKKELFRIPVWARAMRAGGFIELDRGDRASAIASLKRAAVQIRDGVSIWIAPEGSRSKTGRLGPLKKGGFHLARDTLTPIVPMAITGTGAILPPGTTSMRYDCPVRVVFGAPIQVAERTIDELMVEVGDFLRANNGRG